MREDDVIEGKAVAMLTPMYYKLNCILKPPGVFQLYRCMAVNFSG